MSETATATAIPSVRFFVPGTPATAGSKRGVPIYRGKKGEPRVFTGHVAVIEDSKRSQPWRQDVQGVAREAMAGRRQFTGALFVHMRFVMRRPKAHLGAHGLRPSAAVFPAGKPDVLKLARAVEDACNGIVWFDDAQIVTETLEKVYQDAHTAPEAGVLVDVREVASA